MSLKPSEIYAMSDWHFLTQPKVEGQWFERKAHPPSHPPRGLRDFVYERIARTMCGFANSNPDVGGLLVFGIGDAGELHGIDRHGTDYINTLLSYADFLDGPTPEHKLDVHFINTLPVPAGSRHSRESGNPGVKATGNWMPAYAGMTFYWCRTYETDI